MLETISFTQLPITVFNVLIKQFGEILILNLQGVFKYFQHGCFPESFTKLFRTRILLKIFG